MAFETRKRGGTKYLYLAVRDPSGRVKKVYVGTGPKAVAAVEALKKRREQRDADRRALEAMRADLRAVDGLMSEMAVATTLLMEAFLLGEGFHRANYSVWRRRRSEHDHGGGGRAATG